MKNLADKKFEVRYLDDAPNHGVLTMPGAPFGGIVCFDGDGIEMPQKSAIEIAQSKIRLRRIDEA